jgi:DNA-binding NarL/FixJ family response regulator
MKEIPFSSGRASSSPAIGDNSSVPGRALSGPDIGRDEKKPRVAVLSGDDVCGEQLRELCHAAKLPCAAICTQGPQMDRQISEACPHVILVDIDSLDSAGIESIVRVKQRSPRIPMIAVSAWDHAEIIVPALKAGASGHLLRSALPGEVDQAIHIVLHGGAPLSTEIARHLVEGLHQSVWQRAARDALSKREKEVLDFVCEGLANKEIADRLDISPETVRMHLKGVFGKLGVRSRTAAAMKYRGDQRERGLPGN